MLRLGELTILESKEGLKAIPQGKVLINTINAHSFNTAQKDALFAEALKKGDYLIPDGASIVKACRWLKCPHRKGLPMVEMSVATQRAHSGLGLV